MISNCGNNLPGSRETRYKAYQEKLYLSKENSDE